MNNKLSTIFFIVVASILIGIAVYPETPAELLTDPDQWVFHGNEGSKISLHEIPEQFRQIRHSVIESDGDHLFRTWTPAKGIAPAELSSGLFSPSRYMSVVITGTNRTPTGLVQTYIECESNNQRIEVFRGGVNVNVAESLVAVPSNWCPDKARLILRSSEHSINVGVGSVYEVSLLSYLKSSFIGRVPYFLAAFIIFALVMFTGGALASRMGWHDDLIPVAFSWFGFSALVMFYLASITSSFDIPDNWRWLSFAIVTLASAGVLSWSGPTARMQARHSLYPYAKVWAFASLTYFSLLSLVNNGVGHWEPNYRFWPATWSSDHELPWLFAEAIRQGWNLKGLIGGGWLPTDRPPLMAGAHLLLSDAFGSLQANNDGRYLLGSAYNAAAILLNALWVPAVWWLLKTLCHGLDDRRHLAILVFVACIPFVLFNTIYGWPKAFGTAFALLAFGMAWQSRPSVQFRQLTILLFFMLGIFSMLAHFSVALFLAPLGLLFLFWRLRSDTRTVFIGFGIALALLISWSLYKSIVLPSAEPITKFALTGAYGFEHPEWSLWQMLSDRYREINFSQWLEIKKTMLMQVFLPVSHSITQIDLNMDYGAGEIDKLRAWDFMLLSKGNAAIPVFSVVVVWVSLSAFVLRRRDILQGLMPFVVLVGISLAAWLLVVLGFFAPAILHQLPQAAVFGLAIGGAIVTQQRFPLLFRLILIALLSYTGAVWVLSPLQNALSIDIGAGVALSALIAFGLASKLAPYKSHACIK